MSFKAGLLLSLTGMCGSAKSLVKNLGLLLMKNFAADRPDSSESEYSD